MVGILLLGFGASASEPAGKEQFDRWCAPCHGRGPGIDGSPMLPGTAALERKYQGQVAAALEDRQGLTQEYLRQIIRNGLGAMPMFRKVEVSDRDIDAIASYLNQPGLNQPGLNQPGHDSGDSGP